MENEMKVSLNDGTIVAIAGKDFAVIAADSLISSNNFNPPSKQDKLFQVSPVAVMSSTGSWPDNLALSRLMRATVSDYEKTHLRPMSIDSMSQMLSNNIYKRRYLPCSMSTILAGIDKEGKGAVFWLDTLGHCEQINYQAAGTAVGAVLPLLDSHLGFNNQNRTASTEGIEVNEAVSLIANCMVIARGGGLVKIINKDGIEVKELPLRQE